jgi:hypothetical protein
LTFHPKEDAITDVAFTFILSTNRNTKKGSFFI